MTPSPADLRRHPRRPLALPVEISSLEPEVQEATGTRRFRSVRTRCGNLSRGGMYVPIEEPFAPGRRVRVTIQLPDGRRVEALGRVAWSRKMLSNTPEEPGFGNGLEFLGVDPRHLSLVESLLKS